MKPRLHILGEYFLRGEVFNYRCTHTKKPSAGEPACPKILVRMIDLDVYVAAEDVLLATLQGLLLNVASSSIRTKSKQ